MKRGGTRRTLAASTDRGDGTPPVGHTLEIRNRQRRRRIDTRWLKRLLVQVLNEQLAVVRYEVGLHLVGDTEMTAVNETFLQHEGSTDVITFDHRDSPSRTELAGEMFICVDEAVRQAPRFRSTWQQELVRYAVHGFLHLQGHDDRTSSARARMKRQENRVMRHLRRAGGLAAIDRSWKNARQD